MECAKMHSCYRVFGHLDYVNRYGGFDDKTLYYKDYADIIDEILKTIIKGERGIEIQHFWLSLRIKSNSSSKRHLETLQRARWRNHNFRL